MTSVNDALPKETNRLMGKCDIDAIKRSCLRDLFAISFIALCVYTAFNTIRDIETSLNRDNGFIALGSLNVGVVTSILLSPVIFNLLRPKYIISLNCVGNAMYVVSHLYPRLYILAFCFFLLGLTLGPAVAAFGMYITKLSIRYASMSHSETPTSTLGVFNGIYFTFAQSAYVWGNILSSTLLFQVDTKINPSNGTEANCGVHFCPHKSRLPIVRPVETYVIRILLSVLLGCDALALVISLCVLGDLEDDDTKEMDGHIKKPGFTKSLRELFHLTRQTRLLLVIPLFTLSAVGMVLVVGSFPLVSYNNNKNKVPADLSESIINVKNRLKEIIINVA